MPSNTFSLFRDTVKPWQRKSAISDAVTSALLNMAGPPFSDLKWIQVEPGSLPDSFSVKSRPFITTVPGIVRAFPHVKLGELLNTIALLHAEKVTG